VYFCAATNTTVRSCCDDCWNPSGGVLGDICQPHRVRDRSGEAAPDEVVVDRRAGPAIDAPLLGEDAPDPLRRTQPVDPVLARTDTPGGQLVGDEPVAESRVVGVDVESGVDQMRVVSSTLRDRALFPFVERLGGEAEYPLCHRDRDTVSGQVEDQRVAHFGLTSREK
jgi:hypothetical protein